MSRRLRDAMGRIARTHPELGRHLDASVRTGVFCAYAPEMALSWSVGTDQRSPLPSGLMPPSG